MQSRIWLVIQINISTAEAQCPSANRAYIHCFISTNIQQTSMNVIWKNSLTHYCFRYTFISFMLFGQTDVKLQRQKNINLLTEGFNPYCHTTNICFWYYGITNVFFYWSLYVFKYVCTPVLAIFNYISIMSSEEFNIEK